MKKNVLFILLIISTLSTFSQPTSLAVSCKNHGRFWILINNIPQNEHPVESICIHQLPPANYNVRIILNNDSRSEMSYRLSLQPLEANNYELHFSARHNRIFIRSVKYPIAASFAMNWIPNHGNPHSKPYAPSHDGKNGYGQPPYQSPHPNNPPPPQPAPALTQPQICSANDLERIVTLIETEQFDDTRLTIAKQAVASELMTTDQLIRIAKLFTFDNSKLNFLKFAYEFCADKNKYYFVNSVFTFSSSKDELNEYITHQQF